ncbi:MAG: hypothetical protein LZF86_110183 [Nitrospira sp.]|nr:MAG: hypothetical protein LZF86_110183 [Nitrospira sp.]
MSGIFSGARILHQGFLDCLAAREALL